MSVSTTIRVAGGALATTLAAAGLVLAAPASAAPDTAGDRVIGPLVQFWGFDENSDELGWVADISGDTLVGTYEMVPLDSIVNGTLDWETVVEPETLPRFEMPAWESGFGPIVAPDGRCLSAPGTGAVILTECSDAPDQQWSMDYLGQLENQLHPSLRMYTDNDPVVMQGPGVGMGGGAFIDVFYEPAVVEEIAPPAITAVAPDGKDVTVSGTGEPGSTITVEIDGAEVTATVDPEGTWTAEVAGVSVGTHEVTATQTTDGQETGTATDTVTIDSVFTAEVTGQDGTTITIGGLADEPGAEIHVTVNGGEEKIVIAGEDSTWTAEVEGIEGENVIDVTQTIDGSQVGPDHQLTVVIAATPIIDPRIAGGALALAAAGAVALRSRRTQATRA